MARTEPGDSLARASMQSFGAPAGTQRSGSCGAVLFDSAKSTKNRREGPVVARSAWSCPSRLPINDLLRLFRCRGWLCLGPTLGHTKPGGGHPRAPPQVGCDRSHITCGGGISQDLAERRTFVESDTWCVVSAPQAHSGTPGLDRWSFRVTVKHSPLVRGACDTVGQVPRRLLVLFAGEKNVPGRVTRPRPPSPPQRMCGFPARRCGSPNP